MRRLHVLTAAAVMLLVTGVIGFVRPAEGDGLTAVTFQCPEISIPLTEVTIPSFPLPIPLEADDDVDPVEPNGTVVNTFRLPVDLGGLGGLPIDYDILPVPLRLRRIRIVLPIPEGITVTGFSGSSEDFAGTHGVSNGKLTISLDSDVLISTDMVLPTIPDLVVTTTVGSEERLIEWKAPSSFEIQLFLGSGWLGVPYPITCDGTSPDTVLLSTTVQDPTTTTTTTEATTTTTTEATTTEATTTTTTEPSGPVRTSAESFVTAAYVDYVGRQPTPAEMSRALADLGDVHSAVARGRLSKNLSESETYVGAFIDLLYQNTLGRSSDDDGHRFWRDRLVSGRWTPAEVGAYFYASPEYFGGIGGGTLTSWVDDLYQKVLMRTPDPVGSSHWVEVARRRNRQAASLPMYQSRESSRKRVRTLYDHFLGRGPDTGGLDHWGDRIPAEGDLALATFLTRSSEYLARAESRFP